MKFRIYRYDPEKDAKPYLKDYDVALDPHDRMLLDALVRVKAVDDTLAFRRSYREGVCGSDAIARPITANVSPVAPGRLSLGIWVANLPLEGSSRWIGNCYVRYAVAFELA